MEASAAGSFTAESFPGGTRTEHPRFRFRYVKHQRPTETLLDFLVRRFPYHDAAAWRERIEDGQIALDGTPTHRAETPLRSGIELGYFPPWKPEPAVDARVEVLYEDESLLALNKSGNIPTAPSGKYWRHCLLHVAQRRLRLRSLYAVHRLDRCTSGVNLFAKTRQTAARLGQDFRLGRVQKAYSAVVRGAFPLPRLWIDAPLGPDLRSAVRIRQAIRPQDGKSARTLVIRRGTRTHRRSGEEASWLTLIPSSGRTHQLRVHLASVGHPVWDDLLYGASNEAFLAALAQRQDTTGQAAADATLDQPDLGRHTGAAAGQRSHLLHAHWLGVRHPSGRWLSLVADDRHLLAAFR